MIADEDREQIETYRQMYAKPGMTAGEFAAWLPENLRSPYWQMKLAEYFDAQGIEA